MHIPVFYQEDAYNFDKIYKDFEKEDTNFETIRKSDKCNMFELLNNFRIEYSKEIIYYKRYESYIKSFVIKYFENENENEIKIRNFCKYCIFDQPEFFDLTCFIMENYAHFFKDDLDDLWFNFSRYNWCLPLLKKYPEKIIWDELCFWIKDLSFVKENLNKITKSIFMNSCKQIIAFLLDVLVLDEYKELKERINCDESKYENENFYEYVKKDPELIDKIYNNPKNFNHPKWFNKSLEYLQFLYDIRIGRVKNNNKNLNKLVNNTKSFVKNMQKNKRAFNIFHSEKKQFAYAIDWDKFFEINDSSDREFSFEKMEYVYDNSDYLLDYIDLLKKKRENEYYQMLINDFMEFTNKSPFGIPFFEVFPFNNFCEWSLLVQSKSPFVIPFLCQNIEAFKEYKIVNQSKDIDEDLYEDTIRFLAYRPDSYHFFKEYPEFSDSNTSYHQKKNLYVLLFHTLPIDYDKMRMENFDFFSSLITYVFNPDRINRMAKAYQMTFREYSLSI